VDTKEYIASGILEAYALGLLAEEERSQVEAMAAKDPEIQRQLQEEVESLSTFSQAYAVQPPPELRDKVLAAALKTENKAATEPTEKEKVQNQKGTSPWAVAATVLFLISGGFNFFQYQQSQSLQQNLNRTELRLAEMETQNEVLVARYEIMEENVAVLTDPNTAQFIMKGVEGRDQQMRADIFWNASTETVYLDVKNLPQPPSDKDYQLWALKDGKPIDMGVFNNLTDAQELLKVGQVPGADAFAVTLEPKGGSESPTLEEMYVYGEPVQV